MSSDSNHFFAENNQAMEDDEAMEQVDMALMIDDVEGTRRRNAEGHALHSANDNTRIGKEQAPPHATGNITLAQPQPSNTRIWMEQATPHAPENIMLAQPQSSVCQDTGNTCKETNNVRPPSQFYANPTLQQAETYAQETPIHTRGYAKVHPQIRYSHRKTLISQPLYVDHSVQQTELLIIH